MAIEDSWLLMSDNNGNPNHSGLLIQLRAWDVVPCPLISLFSRFRFF